MSVTAILAPLFVQIVLTFFLLFWMGRSRVSVIRAGDVRIKDIALGERSWPRRVQQVSNAFHNQLELPVLFYVLVVLALITRKADMAFVVMAWLFVATRIVHAYVHTTSNRVNLRFQLFLIGALILMLNWILFILRVIFADFGV